VRQFIMKDSYSFDLGPEGLDVAYQKHHDAYRRIFDRCGLKYVIVEAHSGAMGGSQSHEFMVKSDAGEDYIVQCDQCGYAANLEKAVSELGAPAAPDPDGNSKPEEFHTPGKKTIAEVSEFDGAPLAAHIKSLVMVADEKPVLALLRGDHSLSETKFTSAIGAHEFRPAHPEEMRQWLGADAGSLGPVGVNKQFRVIADRALEGRRNMVAGANKDDYHLRNVTPGKDFKVEYFDLRQVVEGDRCVRCGNPLRLEKSVEIGHIFKLGYKYSESMGLRVASEAGEDIMPIMGCYGIGIERILSAAVELFHDQDGMSLPPSIAPFFVVVTPVNFGDAKQRETAASIYTACRDSGLDALLDDRDERPGVKFKDADLIGIPYRVTVGKKLAQGNVEVVDRRTKKSTDVAITDVVTFLKSQ
jgi:prolyl-tRNA synthetase